MMVVHGERDTLGATPELMAMHTGRWCGARQEIHRGGHALSRGAQRRSARPGVRRPPPRAEPMPSKSRAFAAMRGRAPSGRVRHSRDGSCRPAAPVGACCGRLRGPGPDGAGGRPGGGRGRRFRGSGAFALVLECVPAGWQKDHAARAFPPLASAPVPMHRPGAGPPGFLGLIRPSGRGSSAVLPTGPASSGREWPSFPGRPEREVSVPAREFLLIRPLMPRIVAHVSEWRALRASARAAGPLGFVPTMGALHPARLAFAAARARGDQVLASVLSIRRQFDDRSDFERYPAPGSATAPSWTRRGRLGVRAELRGDVPQGTHYTVAEDDSAGSFAGRIARAIHRGPDGRAEAAADRRRGPSLFRGKRLSAAGTDPGMASAFFLRAEIVGCPSCASPTVWR